MKEKSFEGEQTQYDTVNTDMRPSDINRSYNGASTLQTGFKENNRVTQQIGNTNMVLVRKKYGLDKKTKNN